MKIYLCGPIDGVTPEWATGSEPATKKQYWCMFCSYRVWYEVKGEEFRSCPRCGNGMFVWEGSQHEQKR